VAEKTVTGFVVRTRRILGVVRENAEIGRFAVRRRVCRQEGEAKSSAGKGVLGVILNKVSPSQIM